jgi:hypothetical protein
LAGKAIKLMHRFTPEQVEAKMDEAERKQPTAVQSDV